MTALHLQADDPCCKAKFDVIILYPGGISLTINKPNISLGLTKEQAQYLIDNPTQVFVGTFIVTVYYATCQDFSVIAYTFNEYTYDTKFFKALSLDTEKKDCKLSIFSNKTPDGVVIATQFYDKSVVIIKDSSSPPHVMKRVINTYMLPGQIKTLESRTCYMPLYFTVTGV